MSTSNPFDKLNIRREEEEDDQGEFEQVKSKEKNIPYGIEQKKKKIRPKEVEKEKEGGDEGFEEVPGKIKKRRPVKEEEENEESKTHKKRKGVNYNTQEEREYRLKDKPKRGREYDRQSGTGRGKEIAKGGAGGKGTWGDNPENIAKNYEKYNDDDYYFESALNQEKRKERRKRKNEEDNKEENKEEEDNKEEKKDKPQRKPIEIKEEDKLNRPENEMSLEDYLKSKEKPKEEEDTLKRLNKIYNSLNNGKQTELNKMINNKLNVYKPSKPPADKIAYSKEEYFYFGYALASLMDNRNIFQIYLDLLNQCQIIFKFCFIPFNIYEDRKLQLLYYASKIKFFIC